MPQSNWKVHNKVSKVVIRRKLRCYSFGHVMARSHICKFIDFPCMSDRLMQGMPVAVYFFLMTPQSICMIGDLDDK